VCGEEVVNYFTELLNLGETVKIPESKLLLILRELNQALQNETLKMHKSFFFFAQAHFKNERGQNPKEYFEHESKNAQGGDQDQYGNNRLRKMSHRREEGRG
jgi:hypothetical protein